MNYTSASAISLTEISFPRYNFSPGPSEVCSSCGTDLYWYGEVHENGIVSIGWHRNSNVLSSYVSNLCDNCCLEHTRNIK